MGLLIKFPSSSNSSIQSQEDKNISDTSHSEKESNIYEMKTKRDEKQDQIFLNLIKQWPCCEELSQKLDLETLLEMYYDDELTTQQDYVLEYLFHMHDPKSSFDIANALYSWGENDRNFFILSINLHAEIIDQIKKKEY